MLPEEFLRRMEGWLGEDYAEFLASYDQPRAQALRINTWKKTESGESMMQALTALFRMEKVPWAEHGYYYDGETQPGRHPYHEAGLYYIQEPSAMAPVGYLEVKPGERVLDLCAAPGGKSTQIGALLNGEGILISNEINPARAKILSENVERMGLANTCVTNESPQKLAEAFPMYFDKILVDAPCSGEGMFKKNEIALTEWSPENVELCARRQDEILDEAVKMLRPGGRLVYSTCTFAEAENEGTIERFLKRHPEFELVKNLRLQYGKHPEEMKDFDGMLRLYPHQIRGEGHFLAVLRKGQHPGETDSKDLNRVMPVYGFAKPVPEKDCKEWNEFRRDTLCDTVERCVFGRENSGQYLKFGDNLYLVPKEFPDLKGLKVLRPGLHLGEIKKNRFEPSHALALALGAQDVRNVYRMNAENGQASSYISGQTFQAEGEKGWYLICVDGVSIGWGKLAGGIMKNHYPKGLRKG